MLSDLDTAHDTLAELDLLRISANFLNSTHRTGGMNRLDWKNVTINFDAPSDRALKVSLGSMFDRLRTAQAQIVEPAHVTADAQAKAQAARKAKGKARMQGGCDARLGNTNRDGRVPRRAAGARGQRRHTADERERPRDAGRSAGQTVNAVDETMRVAAS